MVVSLSVCYNFASVLTSWFWVVELPCLNLCLVFLDDGVWVWLVGLSWP